MERRQEKKMRPRYLLYFDFIAGFNDHSEGEKIFLNLNEMDAPPRQGVKMCYSFPGIYLQNLMLKAFKLC